MSYVIPHFVLQGLVQELSRDLGPRGITINNVQPGPVDTGNPDDEDRSQDDLFAELARLEAFMSEMEGRGGDEQWRGAWYPVTIIRDSYFVDYCQELCADIGDIPRDMPAYLVIDWEATARNIQQDYTSVEFDGVTYWVR